MGQTKLLKLPRGVTIRKHRQGETINITFTYKGVKCREPLSNLEVTPKNIKYAERTLGEIHNKIERGTFIYAEYFPRSARLKIFGNAAAGKTVKMYLDEYLEICETRKLSPSTIGGYKKCRSALASLHICPASELTPAILKAWIQSQKTTLKTIRNQLSFLRSALDEAVTDGVLQINPVSLVTASRYQSDKSEAESSYVVDPLSPAEVDALLAAAGNKQWENLFRFAIHTGLRSSELCALRWRDIDFVGKTAHVQSASVVGVIKGTKTKAGTRKVELTEDAMLALINQKPFTFMKDATVFEDPKTNKPWASADAIRKKRGYQPCVKQVSGTVTHIRPGIHSPPAISAGEQTCFGLQLKWAIRDQKCYFVTMAVTLLHMTDIPLKILMIQNRLDAARTNSH